MKKYHFDRPILIILAVMMLSLTDCKKMDEYRQRIASIEIENIDLSQVKDGEYTGDYDAILVKVSVLVKVKDHRIESVDLVKHENGRGKKAEVIPSLVVEKQSLKVDTVSGATASSLVILEAIEQALKKGM
ncbi:MAG: FMN-binding protein [Candidatus Marinimicrobia bacterium]|nr:FMN-binding protein [Candidatus Neomarinimicrobiota bacterium]